MPLSSSNLSRTSCALIIFSLSILLISCGGSGGGSNSTPPPPTLASITVSPQQATVAAGLSQKFSAVGIYSDGSSHSVSDLSWSTSSPTIATVDATGEVTTHAQGTVTIIASSVAISGSAPLSVGPPNPVALSISPANPTTLIGSAPTKLSALLSYTDGSSQDVSSTSTWTTTNAFATTIDNSGNVTPLRAGYTTVTAVSGTLSATSPFVVTAQPRFLYFMSDEGRLVSKAAIDSSSGQLRMSGYMPTNANGFAVFHCPTTDPAGKFLYDASSLNGSVGGEIQTYSIDPVQGDLTPVGVTPTPESVPVDCIEFEPTGKFAYAASAVNGSSGLLIFSADSSTGLLTLVNTLTLPGIPSRVAIDPLGQYLYVVVFTNNFQSASANGYSINSSTGALTPIAGTPFSLSDIAGTFSFHPSGNFVFLADTNGAQIDTYSIDRSSGKLTAAGSISTCINPSTVRFSPNGNFAYTACEMDANHDQNSASVDSFTVGANGALTHLSTTPSTGGDFDLTVDPSGQFLYVTNVYPYLYLFQIGPDGSAKYVRRFGVPTNQGMTLVATGGSSPIQYSTKTAYVTSTTDSALLTYSVNSDGTLQYLQSSSTTSPAFSLSLWPWQSNLLMASAVATPNLLSFPLSSAGIPGTADSFGTAAVSGGVAVDPSGQFAFQTDSSQALVYTYQYFGGAWSLITYSGNPPFSSFAAGNGAGPVVSGPSGLLLYVANQIDNTISAYQYWGTSPELFESNGQWVIPYTDGSPFAVGAKPLALAIDPNESYLYVLCSDQALRVFAIDYISAGHLALVATAQLGSQPSGLTVEPKGTFIYTADSTGVKAFSVNASTGVLTPVTVSSPIALANITGVYAEPAGQYLYVTTGSTTVAGAIYGYWIGASGDLTLLSTQPLASPLLPSSMTFQGTNF